MSDYIGNLDEPFKWTRESLELLACPPDEPWVSPDDHDHGHTLCSVALSFADALDEIERLRAENAELRAVTSWWAPMALRYALSRNNPYAVDQITERVAAAQLDANAVTIMLRETFAEMKRCRAGDYCHQACQRLAVALQNRERDLDREATS